MTEGTTVRHGQFVWYELMTSDMAAAEAFYRDVVGWHFTDAGMSGMTYHIIAAAETPIGGVMPLPEAEAPGTRPDWLGYVAVDDVDVSARRVTELGGAVHRPPADIPGVGRFAVVADPGGAVLILFRGLPELPSAPHEMGKPGHPGWRELMAADGDAAFAFYADLFGWTKAEAHDMGAMGVYQIFAVDGQSRGGMMTKPASVPRPRWTYYFCVDGINEAAARVVDAGGQVVNGPMEVPGGTWIVQAVDPQGGFFALVGPHHR